MVDHGIEVPRGHEKGEAGALENSEGLDIGPVGLRNNTDTVPERFEMSSYYRRSEGRVVYVGIP